MMAGFSLVAAALRSAHFQSYPRRSRDRVSSGWRSWGAWSVPPASRSGFGCQSARSC